MKKLTCIPISYMESARVYSELSVKCHFTLARRLAHQMRFSYKSFFFSVVVGIPNAVVYIRSCYKCSFNYDVIFLNIIVAVFRELPICRLDKTFDKSFW